MLKTRQKTHQAIKAELQNRLNGKWKINDFSWVRLFLSSKKSLRFRIWQISLQDLKTLNKIQNSWWRDQIQGRMEESGLLLVESHRAKKSLMKSFWLDSAKIQVIEPRISIAKTESDYQILTKTILFLGEKAKNEVLIAAFTKFQSHHPDWKIALAGTENLDFAHLKTVIANSAMVVSNLNAEDYKFELSSVLALGKPLISQDDYSSRKVFDRAVYFCDFTDSKLAYAMMEIYSNQKLTKELINKGFDRLKWLQSPNMTEQIELVINKLNPL